MRLKQAPIIAVQPTGEAVQLAQVVTPPPRAEMQAAAPVQTAQVAARTLPATASPVPLLALFGFLTLGAALTIRSIKTSVL